MEKLSGASDRRVDPVIVKTLFSEDSIDRTGYQTGFDVTGFYPFFLSEIPGCNSQNSPQPIQISYEIAGIVLPASRNTK